jgi:hypothetical protein
VTWNCVSELTGLGKILVDLQELLPVPSREANKEIDKFPSNLNDSTNGADFASTNVGDIAELALLNDALP